MMDSLSGKVALVTGASYGIGRAIAITLGRKGYNLVLVARGAQGYFGEEPLLVTKQRVQEMGVKVLIKPTDISQAHAVRELRDAVQQEFGRLDVLVNAASALPEQENVEQVGVDVVESLANTSFKGTVLVTQSFLPLLKASQGHIIFFSSDWAQRGSGGPAVFSAAKAAVAQFARTLSRQVLPDGVKITTIFPGDVASYDPGWETPKYDVDTAEEDIRRDFEEYAKRKELPVVPLRVHMREIADVVVFVLERRTARVEEIIISPTYGSYDYTLLNKPGP